MLRVWDPVKPGPASPRPPVSAAPQAMLRHLAAERVAVNAQSDRSLGFVSVHFFQNLADEPPLELNAGILKADLLVDHLDDEGFQLFFHKAAPGFILVQSPELICRALSCPFRSELS